MREEILGLLAGIRDIEMGSMLKLAKSFNCFYINDKRVFCKIIAKFIFMNI